MTFKNFERRQYLHLTKTTISVQYLLVNLEWIHKIWLKSTYMKHVLNKEIKFCRSVGCCTSVADWRNRENRSKISTTRTRKL